MGVAAEKFAMGMHGLPCRPMNQIDRSFNLRALGIAPISGVLIGLSIVVAILSRLGADDGVLMHLFISTTGTESGLLPEVLHGQAWRLLTPIFIHFGFIHLLFNLLWLKDLGAMIERLGSPRLFLSLVVVIGIVSNVGQYLIYGPFFGGMSGVVYGLLGFVWMKSKFDPHLAIFCSSRRWS